MMVFQKESGLPGVQKSGHGTSFIYPEEFQFIETLERRIREVPTKLPFPIAAMAETKQRPIKGPSGTPRNGPSDRGW